MLFTSPEDMEPVAAYLTKWLHDTEMSLHMQHYEPDVTTYMSLYDRLASVIDYDERLTKRHCDLIAQNLKLANTVNNTMSSALRLARLHNPSGDYPTDSSFRQYLDKLIDLCLEYEISPEINQLKLEIEAYGGVFPASDISDSELLVAMGLGPKPEPCQPEEDIDSDDDPDAWWNKGFTPEELAADRAARIALKLKQNRYAVIDTPLLPKSTRRLTTSQSFDVVSTSNSRVRDPISRTKSLSAANSVVLAYQDDPEDWPFLSILTDIEE